MPVTGHRSTAASNAASSNADPTVKTPSNAKNTTPQPGSSLSKSLGGDVRWEYDADTETMTVTEIDVTGVDNLYVDNLSSSYSAGMKKAAVKEGVTELNRRLFEY